jgi:hypothetical protein
MRGYPDRDFPCRGFFVRPPHAVQMVIARVLAGACARSENGPHVVRFAPASHIAPARARLSFAPI